MLFTKSGLKPGQTMLVQGGSGGVATALIQLGRAAGIEVWATSRTREGREVAERLGAHRTFASGEKLPRRVNAVMDNVGQATWPHTLESVGRGGTVVTMGVTTGSDPSANLMRLFVEQITVAGTVMGTLEEMNTLIQFVISTGIKPAIGQVMPMEKAKEGFQVMAEAELMEKPFLPDNTEAHQRQSKEVFHAIQNLQRKNRIESI
jgi:NADPH:quinone reductase-like Zn-dependent oxidoreductase